MSDDLTLTIGGQAFSGWQSIRVTRGAERVPASFDIGATERYPGQINDVQIKPFSACQIKIGSDLVLTGYVDRVIPSISGEQHSVRIQGRSKLEDPVDCAVTPDVITGMQIVTFSLLWLATAVCKPFGINVKSLTGDDVPVGVPGGGPLVFNAVLSETGYEVIERVARYAQVLVYDDTDGSMILARAGESTPMGSGFVEGINVQEASIAYSGDQRFSVYQPMLMSYEFFGQEGIGGTKFPAVNDKTVPRYRPTVVISEQFQYGQSFAEQRAQWEMARRYGRSQAVRIVCDSWRDALGNLWTPNALAPIDLPHLKLSPPDPWVISDVTYSRDANRGTVAEIVLMTKQAFTQEPVMLLPFLGYWGSGTGGLPAPGL